MPKSKYKPLAKSRSNTSGRPSAAKREAMKRSKKGSIKKSKSAKVSKAKKAYSYRLSGLNPQEPRQLPETEHTKKGMTLRKLLRGTPRLMLNNSVDVEIVEFKRTKTKSGMPAIKAVTITNDPWRPGKVRRPHSTFVIGMDKDDSGSPDIKKPINKHKRVIVSCNCVAGDTKVLTDKGWKRIYEIAEEFDPENLKITYIVNGKKYRGTAPYYTGRKKVFTLRFSNGSKVVATGEHRFLVKPTRGEPEWRELRDITVGDNLLLSKKEQMPKLPEKSERFHIAQFLGFMQGDGTLTSPNTGAPDLQIYDEDKMDMLDRLADLGVVENTYTNGRNAERVRFNHKAVEYMRRYGYNNVDAIRWRSKEEFYGYLSGLICADASVSSRHGKILSLQLRGAESYIRPVYETLHRLGYYSTSMRLERKAGTETNRIVGMDQVLVSKKDLYCLTISARNFSHLRDYLELTPRFHEYDFKEFRDYRLPLTKVVEKFYSKKQHVYDITVPDIHQFVIDGSVISHNCENFVFTWEYANAAHGASRIVYGNGEPPVVTNPQLAPGLCKHLVAVATRLIKKGI